MAYNDEERLYALGGSMQGAQAGWSAGGVWGAVAGGVIGGVVGGIAGHQAQRARKQAKKAMKLQRAMSLQQAAVSRRDLIRQGRIERASMVAASAAQEGGLQSSAPAGAISSYGAQYGWNLGYFDNVIYNYLKMQRHLDKAGKYARRAGDTMNYLNMATSLVSMGGSMGGGVTGSQMGGMMGGAGGGGGGSFGGMGANANV